MADGAFWPNLLIQLNPRFESGGAFAEQQQQVAQVSSDIFGVRVLPEHVIGESLQRSTPGELDTEALSAVIAAGDALVIPADYDAFVAHPLSIWIENTFGLRNVGARPRPGRSGEEAILNLKVCDPATGSGHFLIAAVNRMAKRLASLRSNELEPPPAEVQRASGITTD